MADERKIINQMDQQCQWAVMGVECALLVAIGRVYHQSAVLPKFFGLPWPLGQPRCGSGELLFNRNLSINQSITSGRLKSWAPEQKLVGLVGSVGKLQLMLASRSCSGAHPTMFLVAVPRVAIRTKHALYRISPSVYLYGVL
jgi:hypothetical protein